MAETFKDHFENIVESLHIEHPCKVDFDREPVADAIKIFSQHPSILKVKENMNSSACFSFRAVSKEDLLYQLNGLDPAKATQKSDIPTNIIKNNYDIFSEFLFENFNNIILTSLFPEQLKYADVKPIFKKDSRNDKRNYRPVIILSNISKIYEQLLYKQLETYFESILSQYQCGFRKGFGVWSTLLLLIEKWGESPDSGGNFGALLTDLSKAFDCLPHDLLIAKLHAYGLDMASLKLLHSYLTERRQRVKINNTYSSWSEILFGVPQGSILGPLLFNIFLCDLFLFVSDIGIANHTDDNTPHATDKHLETVLKDLEQGSDTLLKWFTDNLLKANPEKYHVLVSTNEKRHLNVSEVEISNIKCEKFLGIKIDSN